MKLNKIVLCFAVAAVTLSIGIFFEIINFRVGIGIPHSWGIFKGVIDPVLVIIFPWAGWIFLIPLLFALLFGLSIQTIFLLWLVVVISMGVADTIISFPLVTGSRLVKGVFFYACIFGSLLIPVVIINSLLKMKNES